jgi:hypothetical protein
LIRKPLNGPNGIVLARDPDGTTIFLSIDAGLKFVFFRDLIAILQ